MPVICAAVGCNNRFIKGSEIRFYRFPLSKPQLASKWVNSLGLKNFIPTPNTCLCSEHFRPDCFRDYNGKQFLREDAVPTLYTHGHEGSRIELRKRGVVPKENPSSQLGSSQTDPNRGRGDPRRRREEGAGYVLLYCRSSCDQRVSLNAKNKVYDANGRLLSNGKDLCDCLDCSSRKCGVECRRDRKWLYEQVEVEGGQIVRNQYAI
uniref:THAP domain-containing protein 1 n=1 Tax=Neogobius melanostomus TaxID=47308 RepID=A0A8C6T3L7_9GOBI